jgi:hypothetical protein
VQSIRYEIVLSCLLIYAAGCSRNASVDLTIDFSKAPAWRYTLDARVSGTIAGADTQRAFASAAACTLRGTVDAKNSSLLHVSVPSARFTSNVLSDAELENLMSQSREVHLACNLRDGTIAPDDSGAMPLIRIGEWDIFKDLVKTIPALPKIKVAPGATWDREKEIPLATRRGDGTGHLMQSFRLDSIMTDAGGKTVARIRWNFTYQVELRDRDTAGLLDRIPSKGSGTGRARINVSDKTLEHASISFIVPQASEGTYRISWKEDISLNLVR